MKNEIKKFLQFNNKVICFKEIDGVWWIAVKPICEALNVDYSRQLRTLKSDEIFGQQWSLKTIVAADGKFREMVCLPELFTYGWLLSLQSDSAGLKKYKWECYQLLHNHFHGTITGQKSFLLKKLRLNFVKSY